MLVAVATPSVGVVIVGEVSVAVTIVGLVARTSAPVPVSSEIAAARLAESDKAVPPVLLIAPNPAMC
jgi:hypothetical protein